MEDFSGLGVDPWAHYCLVSAVRLTTLLIKSR
jgi:hypothetical protein